MILDIETIKRIHSITRERLDSITSNNEAKSLLYEFVAEYAKLWMAVSLIAPGIVTPQQLIEASRAVNDALELVCKEAQK